MRTLLLIPLLALLVSGLALTEAQPQQLGWVSLFEGVSLRGWSGQEESDWNVSEGHLTATTGQLLNRWCWVDFELSFSFRGKGTLLFRVGSDQMGHIGFGQTGYRMELPPQTIPEPGQAGSSREPDPASSRSWQTARLIVTGDHFRLLINDQPAIEMTDDRYPLKGRIGLAASGEPFSIEFVRIRPLNVEQAENIPADNFYCYVCHSNFEYDDPLVSVHEEVEVGCASCHGASAAHRSDEDNVTPPEVFYRPPQIAPLCLGCHEQHEEKDPPPDIELTGPPTCIDCHGEHRTPNRMTG